jgi:hypothetical protein
MTAALIAAVIACAVVTCVWLVLRQPLVVVHRLALDVTVLDAVHDVLQAMKADASLMSHHVPAARDETLDAAVEEGVASLRAMYKEADGPMPSTDELRAEARRIVLEEFSTPYTSA